MPKILLVEDDTNLREIFEMRLQADGYETLTADNGEQALTIAMKEKPDLIIADVMMPHLSGFEMVETLRAAPGMATTKVIMMTALGQAEDQARGEKLGVVKYLVKSQVTLEDFAKVVREVLPPGDQGANQNKQESEKKMPDDTTNMPPVTPPADDAAAGTNPISATPADDTAGQMSTADAQAGMDQQVNDAMAAPAPAPDMSAPAPVDGAPASEAPAPAPEMPAESTPPATPPTEPADPGSAL